MTQYRSEAPGPALRERAVDALAEAFARDALSVEEFERRVELAHRAESEGELRLLLADLGQAIPPAPAAPSGRGAPAPHDRRPPAPRPWDTGRPQDPVHRPDQGFVVGVLGGAGRRGSWLPARYNYVVGVLGGAEVDFRDCVLPSGEVTEVRCFAALGGIEIIVPPDVIVETSGVGLLGGFDHNAQNADPAPDAPVLRFTGVAVLGGVDISVRYDGETARDAKRRRKLERKHRRLRGGSVTDPDRKLRP